MYAALSPPGARRCILPAVIKHGRPTERCLQADLGEDWDDPLDKSMAAGDVSKITKELHKLKHQIVNKTADEFTPENSLDHTIKREGITDLKNPMWWKVKVGRWRGAAYQDETGQVWLCAAGYRRGKESTDFYQQFMAEVRADGPDKFLPTEADRDRLADELAETRFFAWERELQQLARDWVMEARAYGISTQTLTDPDGDVLGELTFACVEDDLDGERIVDLTFDFTCKDWSQYELLTWAETVMCLSIDPHEQVWRPINIQDGRGYSMVLDADEAEEFFRSLEDPMGAPGVSIAGSEAHWAHRHRLTEATIMGDAVKGLCGRWFVPRQDHDEKPMCRECEVVYRRIEHD